MYMCVCVNKTQHDKKPPQLSRVENENGARVMLCYATNNTN